VIGAAALPGNSSDGHTLAACIEQAQRVSGVAPRESYVDRGYRAHGCGSDTLGVWIAGSKRGVSTAIHKKIKRRNAVAPVIGHLESDGRLSRNFLKGVSRDAINALLSATVQGCSGHRRVFFVGTG
jgi:transposase, IS5 family